MKAPSKTVRKASQVAPHEVGWEKAKSVQSLYYRLRVALSGKHFYDYHNSNLFVIRAASYVVDLLKGTDS